MSIKSKVFAATATLALVGGAGAMGATSASAATPSCGANCINFFNRDFGTHHSPQFVLDVLRQGEKVGQPIILFRVRATATRRRTSPSPSRASCRTSSRPAGPR